MSIKKKKNQSILSQKIFFWILLRLIVWGERNVKVREETVKVRAPALADAATWPTSHLVVLKTQLT